MTTLNYQNSCKFFAWSTFINSGDANVPDFWVDAVSSQLYSDTEYANMRSQFLGWMTDLANNNLQCTPKTGNPFTPQGISSDSNPPQR